jgi:hypothetical protein
MEPSTSQAGADGTRSWASLGSSDAMTRRCSRLTPSRGGDRTRYSQAIRSGFRYPRPMRTSSTSLQVGNSRPLSCLYSCIAWMNSISATL